VIAVALAPRNPFDVEDKALVELSLSRREKLLARLRRSIDPSDIPISVELVQGERVQQIAAAAHRHDADVIVVGEKTRWFWSPIPRFSQQLVGRIQRPLVVVN
jgi:nucleotide-binding universal stress UspA family protein